jgi:hypothetical protein
MKKVYDALVTRPYNALIDQGYNSVERGIIIGTGAGTAIANVIHQVTTANWSAHPWQSIGDVALSVGASPAVAIFGGLPAYLGVTVFKHAINQIREQNSSGLEDAVEPENPLDLPTERVDSI